VNLTTGQVTIAGAGTTNLTAVRLGDNNYNDSTASAAVVLTVTPVLGGTASISGTNAIGQTLTVNTGSLTGGSGAFIYHWQANSVDIAGASTSSGTYQLTGAEAGKVIRCIVTRADATGSVTATFDSGAVVPFNIVITNIGNDTNDIAVSASPTTGRAGNAITLNFTLGGGNPATLNNEIDFSGTTPPIAAVTALGAGTRTYIVNASDAVNGVITITATFHHTNLILQHIAFPNNNGSVTKTFGDANFTHAISVTDSGTGAITYTSSVPSVATVDNNGFVTIIGAGDTVITATKAACSTHDSATASYTLHVLNASQAAPNHG
jgi:hypothetical protein